MTASVSPEVIEKWRSEFELLIADDRHLSVSKHGAGAYVDDDTYNAFYWFCRSRQSAVIELPKPTECCGTSRHYWPIPLKDHIESQGYRVRLR